MTSSKADADATTIMIGIGLPCGLIAPVLGSLVLLLFAGLKADADTTLAPGVTPAPWPMWLTVVSFYAVVATGPSAAVLGAGGAGLVLGLRRLGAPSVVIALASSLIGAIAGPLCVLVSGALISGQPALITIRSAWLKPGDPQMMAATVTGMVFGVGIWFAVGRQRPG